MAPLGRMRVWLGGVAGGVVGWPVSAGAHTPIAGAGDFLNGMLHPVITPAHLLVLLGLGMVIGRRVPLRLSSRVGVFLVAAAGALALTLTGWVGSVEPMWLLGWALVLGALLAWGKDLPPVSDYGWLAGGAVMVGLDSAADAGTAVVVARTLAGTGVGMAVLVFTVAIYMSLGAGRTWLKVALRVVGSWMAAIALLMLAFHLRR